MAMTTDVTISDVDQPGVRGVFAHPDTPGPWPAVVAFGGSSGGLGPSVGWAPALAREGFAVLAIAYFGAPGLPPVLENIEVEVVERAIAWLIDGHHVDGDRLGVMGISRGSELAVLASVLLDRVGPVVAFAPSGIVWSALGPGGPVDAPAWTFRGEPLPYVAMRLTGGVHPGRPGVPFALRPLFDEILVDPSRWSDAEIAVERAKGPILLVSGEADAMWPSTPMAELIEQRAAARGFAHDVVHLRYPDAGHAGGGVPDSPAEIDIVHPLTGMTYSLGGTKEGNAAARAGSWPRVVEFLRAALP